MENNMRRCINLDKNRCKKYTKKKYSIVTQNRRYTYEV